jgi:hypothetical protein
MPTGAGAEWMVEIRTNCGKVVRGHEDWKVERNKARRLSPKSGTSGELDVVAGLENIFQLAVSHIMPDSVLAKALPRHGGAWLGTRGESEARARAHRAPIIDFFWGKSYGKTLQ